MKSSGVFASETHQAEAYGFRIIKDFFGATESPNLKKILAKPSRTFLQQNHSSTGVFRHEAPHFCISFLYTNTFLKARVLSPEIIKGKIKNQKYSKPPATPGGRVALRQAFLRDFSSFTEKKPLIITIFI